MRILIDTNILIHFEDNKAVSDDFYKFYKTAVENNCRIFYHEAVKKDLENDSDQERRKIILAKLQKYQKLENPAKPDEKFLNQLNIKKTNDLIDGLQLYQVYAEYVELFVTEDKGIHKKAKKLNLNKNLKSCRNNLATITNLSEHDYIILKNRRFFDERYIVN